MSSDRHRRACPTRASPRCSTRSRKAGAEAANYPFTTIEPNVAVVPVRDERLEQVAETVGASEIVWDTIDFHDIAGPRRGRAQGRGARQPASSRTSARPTRSCTSCAPTATRTSIHPEGRVDPLRDIETIETELVLADLEQAERRARARRQTGARRRQARAVAEEAWLREVIAALQAGRPGAHGAGARGRAERRRATSAR